MSWPKSVTLASPRDRLHARGMSRAPIGGDIYKTEGGAPAPVPPVTGITVPVTATNASVQILPADNNRKFLYVVNNDPIGVAYLSFGGQDAVVGQGFRLGPGGGGILLDNNVPTERVTIIGSIANNPNLSMVVA